MTTPLVRRAAVAFFLCLSLFAINVRTASATHFLGGTITWQKDFSFSDPNNDRYLITFQANWRWSFPWTPSPNPPLGSQPSPGQYVIVITDQNTGQQFTQGITQTVVSINQAEDWFVGQYTFAFIAPKGHVLVLDHQSSARSSALLEGNHDTNWRLTTTIDPNTATRSPVSSMVPRIYMQQNQLNSFVVPSIAYEGYTNKFSLATALESSLIQLRPIGVSSCTGVGGVPACTQCNDPLFNGGVCAQGMQLSSTGFITWTPQTLGLYAVQIKITSYDAANNAKVSTPLDFLIDVVGTCPTCATPIVTVQSSYSVVAGHALSIPISVTEPNAQPGTTVSVANTPLPSGATLSSPPGNSTPPYTLSLNWTPSAAQVGSSFVCFQATDSNLRTSFGQACTTITVLANQAPQVGCTATAAFPATSPAGGPVNLLWGISDPEQDALTARLYLDDVLAETIPIASQFGLNLQRSYNWPIGTRVVRLDVSDAALTTSCTTSVTVNKLPQAITFTAPTSIVFGAAAQTLVATSDSGLPVTLERVSGPGSIAGFALTATGVGPIEIKATQPGDATFAAAAPVFQFVSAIDATAPVIAPHATETAEATSASGAVVTYTPPGFTDDVDAPGTATCVPAPGSTFAVGPTTVTCTATDAATNTATSTFTVNVTDTTPPAIDSGANVTTAATGASGAVVTFPTPAALDIVDGSVPVSCAPPSGATFTIASHTVTCTATDAHGNSASTSFTVTVTNHPPAFSTPPNISTPATGPGGATVSFDPTGSDLEDGTIHAVCAPLSGSTFAIGTTPVSCTVTDNNGGSASASFTVTVTNNAPTISVPGNLTAEAGSAAGAAVSFVASGHDVEDGPKTASCAPGSGSTFPIGTTPVTCTVTDVAGASVSAGFTVTVRDTTAPVVTYSGNAGSYGITQTVNITCAATDAVGVVSTTCANISGPAYSFAASNSFSATATDAAGNTGSASTSFTVTATLADLMQMVNQFCANPGVANGLNAKLQAAANANNANARHGQLDAFKNQVQAQIGKTLTAQQAALLLQLVNQFY